MSRVIFNLFDQNTIIESLAMYFGIDNLELYNYLHDRYLSNRNNMDTKKEAELFVERFNIDINNVDSCNIYLRLKHVTISIDALKCLKEYGLRDLKFMLHENTPLHKFLKENKIEINVDEKIIKIGEIKYAIFKSEESRELCKLQCNEKYCFGCKYKDIINKLWLKLYKDRCEIEAFSRGNNENIENYSCVKRNPEILCNLDEIIEYLGQDARLKRNWHNENNNKFYIIDFEMPLSELNKDIDDKIIKFLAECIDTFYGGSSDIYVAINEGEWVPYDKMIITDKELFCNRQ